MRLFTAVDISEPSRKLAIRVMEILGKTGCDVKWVEKQNLHITMKFLGEKSDEEFGKIAAALRAAAEKTESFRIGISGAGVFPSVNSPRVIWLGISGQTEKIAELASRVDEALTGLGIEKEKRPFSAHLTIGRVRSGRNLAKLSAGIKKIQSETPENGTEFEVKELILFHSKLSGKGPEYIPVERFPLK